MAVGHATKRGQACRTNVSPGHNDLRRQGEPQPRDAWLFACCFCCCCVITINRTVPATVHGHLRGSRMLQSNPDGQPGEGSQRVPYAAGQLRGAVPPPPYYCDRPRRLGGCSSCAVPASAKTIVGAVFKCARRCVDVRFRHQDVDRGQYYFYGPRSPVPSYFTVPFVRSQMSPQRYARRASCPTAEGVKKLSSSSDRTVTPHHPIQCGS